MFRRITCFLVLVSFLVSVPLWAHIAGNLSEQAITNYDVPEASTLMVPRNFSTMHQLAHEVSTIEHAGRGIQELNRLLRTGLELLRFSNFAREEMLKMEAHSSSFDYAYRHGLQQLRRWSTRWDDFNTTVSILSDHAEIRRFKGYSYFYSEIINLFRKLPYIRRGEEVDPVNDFLCDMAQWLLVPINNLMDPSLITSIREYNIAMGYHLMIIR